jgi:hypothetical protein
MKVLPLLICTSLTASLGMPAATLLIGGSLKNGNFEAGTAAPDRPFNDTDDWTNVPPTTGSGTTQSTRNAPAGLDSTGDYPGASGGFNAVVNESGDRIFGNDPSYTIQLGDVFDASLYWIDAFNWADSDDQIQIALYVTANDQIDGARTTIATALSGTSATSGAYQLFDAPAIYTADATYVGKNVFVEFHGFDGPTVEAPLGFARVDDFTLQVTAIPEPSAVCLLGLAGLGLLRRRRSGTA